VAVDTGNLLLEKEILLESGTNEVEILVFHVGDYRLGINVAKVREILSARPVTELPKAHPSVVGCFQLRDTVVPGVSLHRHLHQPEIEEGEGALILTEFNHCQTAFVVDRVERIYRISWERVLPVPPMVAGLGSPVTAVTNLDGNLVVMLDFETITATVSQERAADPMVENTADVPRSQLRILLADDSPTVRVAVETTLRRSGYSHVTTFEHGAAAWAWIEEKLSRVGEGETVADLLISDVEMPAMDGFHLTKNIKQHPRLRKLPVILYSSILTPDNRKKGEAVGADAQITKPDLKEVVAIADRVALGCRDSTPAASVSSGVETVGREQPTAAALSTGAATVS